MSDLSHPCLGDHIFWLQRSRPISIRKRAKPKDPFRDRETDLHRSTRLHWTASSSVLLTSLWAPAAGASRATTYCCSFLPSLSESSFPFVQTVDVHDANFLIGSHYSYLDVRTVEEFDEGHVKNAKNIPFYFFTAQGRVKNPKFLEQVNAIYKKDDGILVGCLSGVRSLEAAEVLINAGFKNAKNVGGGHRAWVKNGFAVVVDESKFEL